MAFVLASCHQVSHRHGRLRQDKWLFDCSSDWMAISLVQRHTTACAIVSNKLNLSSVNHKTKQSHEQNKIRSKQTSYSIKSIKHHILSRTINISDYIYNKNRNIYIIVKDKKRIQLTCVQVLVHTSLSSLDNPGESVKATYQTP